MKQISILGCGWLGLPLAKALVKEGFRVKGSVTTASKIPALVSHGIEAYTLEIEETKIVGDIEDFLNASSLLIIAIPPKLKNAVPDSFIQKIKTVLPYVEQSSLKNVLFISSTSVYADDNSIVTEATPPMPDTENGKQLVAAETLLKNNAHFTTTIIRFGGLIGFDRHPVYFLAGKQQLENPLAPINLIHQSDCIGIIREIIAQGKFGETFNAAAPFHPTRKDYYTQKAQALNLPIPQFDDTKRSVGKTISSDKIIRLLDYKFQYQRL
ncbi:SDR family oxidoreductase [Flavobacterium sp.]|uniref:SDR family oxidoreductase n=1 Tax=Flavobacterium sp. TaxID=239 RepID=UPI002FDE28E1